ncbi:MAG: hypothetical protein HC815_35750 [Richelia sp. RM1_1_1]|nr:hypothetical protein [Richelia sp. RM1_1_1]
MQQVGVELKSISLDTFRQSNKTSGSLAHLLVSGDAAGQVSFEFEYAGN